MLIVGILTYYKHNQTQILCIKSYAWNATTTWSFLLERTTRMLLLVMSYSLFYPYPGQKNLWISFISFMQCVWLIASFCQSLTNAFGTWQSLLKLTSHVRVIILRSQIVKRENRKWRITMRWLCRWISEKQAPLIPAWHSLQSQGSSLQSETPRNSSLLLFLSFTAQYHTLLSGHDELCCRNWTL